MPATVITAIRALAGKTRCAVASGWMEGRASVAGVCVGRSGACGGDGSVRASDLRINDLRIMGRCSAA